MPSPDDFTSWYEFLFGVKPTKETVLYGLLALGALFLLLKLLVSDWRECGERNKLILAKLSDYSRYITRKQNWLYIPARFQTNPPEYSVDVSVSARIEPSFDLLAFYLKQVLVEKNANKQLYMVLAGSGMGKTSFAVQLVRRYYKAYSPGTEPFKLYLLPCGNANLLKRVSDISNKDTSVLILDALDESNEAIERFDDYIKELEEVIQPFRIVIVTCRTQFFEDSDQIRRESALRDQGREKGFISYIHHYISPLTDEEINHYLRKLFAFNCRKRRIARQIVDKNNSLMVRPLLLSYIEDLVTGKVDYKRQADIYGTLIEKWINREVAMIQEENKRIKAKEDIYRLSIDFAVDLYQNRQQYGGLYMPLERYKQLENYNLIGENTGHHYRGRSLITWDVSRHWKFAHKSFFEYFLAVKKIEDKSFVVATDGMDMVDSFYRDICQSKVEEELKSGRVEDHHFAFFDRNNVSALIIQQRPMIEYRFFLERPDVLVLDWSLMDDDLIAWLKDVGTGILVIKNYSNRMNSYSREIVNVKEIKVVRFHSPQTPLSQNLQKSFQVKHIVCDTSSRVWRDRDLERIYMEYATIMIQANLMRRYRFILNS